MKSMIISEIESHFIRENAKKKSNFTKFVRFMRHIKEHTFGFYYAEDYRTKKNIETMFGCIELVISKDDSEFGPIGAAERYLVTSSDKIDTSMTGYAEQCYEYVRKFETPPMRCLPFFVGRPAYIFPILIDSEHRMLNETNIPNLERILHYDAKQFNRLQTIFPVIISADIEGLYFNIDSHICGIANYRTARKLIREHIIPCVNSLKFDKGVE